VPIIITDIFFVLMHVYHRLAYLGVLSFTPNEYYSLGLDQSYSEYSQYIKVVAIIFVLVYLKRQAVGDWLYITWATLFLYIVIDDAFSIHETVGEILGHALGFSNVIGLRPQDFGELTILSMVGMFFIVSIYFTYSNSSDEAKTTAQMLSLFLGILIFFGIGVDMAHMIIGPYLPVSGLTLIEDGGELFAMSLLVGYLSTLYIRTPPHTITV
jgi:hypothetical protein